MPSFEASMERLEQLAKKKPEEQDFEYAKAEIEGSGDGKLKLKVGDTNRPDLWSEEGVARVLKGIYGFSKGVPKLAVKKGDKKIIVTENVSGIRPFISGFIADRLQVSDSMLRGMIAIQENLSENFGRKRRQIAIGIYGCGRMKFPVKYDAVAPESVKFAPLEFEEKMSLREILQRHPKGMKYAGLLSGMSKYPLLTDAKGEVLSFPPVINSNSLGKVEIGEESLFVEVTGPDQKQVMLVANILAQYFSDNGARIEPVASVYPNKTRLGISVASPSSELQKVSFPLKLVEQVLGLKLSKEEVASLLGKMQYNAVVSSGKVNVAVPCYRGDIMHPVDVIEDIAIAYGYNRIEPLGMESFTQGSLDKATVSLEKIRRTLIGLGLQETISPILTGRDSSEKMCTREEMVEIENPMTATYSAVRSSLLPSLLSCLAKNKNVSMPQKVFESGECALGLMASELTKVAACMTDSRVSYEDIASALDALLRSIGIEFKVKPVADPRFIEGRAGTVLSGGDKVGVVGEINPQVLNNFGLENPVVAFELNATKLMEKMP